MPPEVDGVDLDDPFVPSGPTCPATVGRVGSGARARVAAIGTAATAGGYSEVLGRLVRGGLAVAVGGQALSLALTTVIRWPAAGPQLRGGAVVWLVWSVVLVVRLALRPLTAWFALATLVVAAGVHVVILGAGDPAAETIQWLMPVTLAMAVVAFSPVPRRWAIVVGLIVPAVLAPTVADDQRSAYPWLVAAALSGVAGASVLSSVAARADRESARARAAVLCAAQREARAAADSQVRALLHDEAVAALRVVRDGLATRDEVRRVASGAVRALVAHRGAASTGLGDLVPRLAAVRCTSVATEHDLPARLYLPTDVAEALVDAVRELVRNIDRHSRARRAWVCATGGAGRVDVVVSDDGRGMGRARLGDGLQRSVLGRLATVGGAATVCDRPGGGTVVRLRWHRPQVEPAVPEEQAVDLRVGLGAITVPFMVAFLVSGVQRYLAGAATAASLAWVVGIAVWLVVLLRCPGELLPRRISAAAATWVGLGAVLYALSLPPGWPVPEVSWAVGATAGMLNVLIVRGRARGAMVALAAQLVSGLVGAARYGCGLLAWQPALAALLVPVAIGVFFGLTVAWLGRMAAESAANRQLAETRAAAESARHRVYERRLGALRARVVPFLREAADADPRDLALRERAAELEQSCRDELRLPEILDPVVRARLRTVRAARGTVRLQGVAPAGDLGPARLLLAQVLDALAGLDRLDVVVTLGAGDAPGASRLTVVVRTDDPAGPAARLRSAGVPTESLPGAVLVEVDLHPVVPG